MNATSRAIRWSTVAAVAIVAGIAGWASYEHAYAVVSAHGETGAVARIYPGTIDVKMAGRVLKGCRRADVESAAWR